MPYNWSFYHPGPIEGEEGGIPLFRYSIIYVYGLIFIINHEENTLTLFVCKTNQSNARLSFMLCRCLFGYFLSTPKVPT